MPIYDPQNDAWLTDNGRPDSELNFAWPYVKDNADELINEGAFFHHTEGDDLQLADFTQGFYQQSSDPSTRYEIIIEMLESGDYTATDINRMFDRQWDAITDYAYGDARRGSYGWERRDPRWPEFWFYHYKF